MNKLFAILHRKRLAYLHTFCTADGKLHVEGQRVMADLKRFCGVNKGGIVISPISRTVDPYATAYRAGQRDTYLRISKFLNLDESELTEVINDEHSSG